MTVLATEYLDAWNARDGAALAALFLPGATYEGPTTPMAVGPFDLPAIVQALAEMFPDYRFDAVSESIAGDRIVIEWQLLGTNEGPVKAGVPATGRQIHLGGVDVIACESGRIRRVSRYYDRRAMMEQLGLQELVEPYQQGKATYGYSLHASSGDLAPPGVIALTWIMGRDEAERDRVRSHSGQIVRDFLDQPGFIGIVTGFAGMRGFTCTAWRDEAALHAALDQHHARAKQDFRTNDLSPAVWTSVWQPLRLNRLWLRCTTCSQPNDMTDDPRQCARCGGALPERPTYW